jgi:hypothetical protein
MQLSFQQQDLPALYAILPLMTLVGKGYNPQNRCEPSNNHPFVDVSGCGFIKHAEDN